MSCMCGDSECPSCGLMQGTLTTDMGDESIRDPAGFHSIKVDFGAIGYQAACTCGWKGSERDSMSDDYAYTHARHDGELHWREVQRVRADTVLGMAWWNHLTERERSEWLRRADSAIPADAWAEFKHSAAEPWLEFQRAYQL